MSDVRVIDLSPIVATVVWLAFLAACVVVSARTWSRASKSMKRWSGSMRNAWRATIDVTKAFLSFENRWRLFLVQLVITVGGLVVVVKWNPVTDDFLDQHSGFFQTAAQVQAGILVALALTQYGDARAARGVRPAVIIAVLLGALALIAGVAGTSPLLPLTLQRWDFGLTISGGTASLASLVLVSWRLLR